MLSHFNAATKSLHFHRLNARKKKQKPSDVVWQLMQIRCRVCVCDPKLLDFLIILNMFDIKYHPLKKQINYSSLDPRLGSTKALNQSLRNCQRRPNVAGVEYPRFWHVRKDRAVSCSSLQPGAPLHQLHKHTGEYTSSLIWGGEVIYPYNHVSISMHVCTYTHSHTHPLKRPCICPIPYHHY